MQDNKDVLVFATANDVRELESEQFRIGRFSYIHFVDLPQAEDRLEIFKVHLSKNVLYLPNNFDLDKLVDKSKDFSGAEIEGAVKDGVLEAFIDGDRAAETRDIVKAIDSITPTAQMMSEKIEEIRSWARKNIKGCRRKRKQSALIPANTTRAYRTLNRKTFRTFQGIRDFAKVVRVESELHIFAPMKCEDKRRKTMSKYMAFDAEAFANRDLLVEALKEMGFEQITVGTDLQLKVGTNATIAWRMSSFAAAT